MAIDAGLQMSVDAQAFVPTVTPSTVPTMPMPAPVQGMTGQMNLGSMPQMPLPKGVVPAQGAMPLPVATETKKKDQERKKSQQSS